MLVRSTGRVPRVRASARLSAPAGAGSSVSFWSRACSSPGSAACSASCSRARRGRAERLGREALPRVDEVGFDLTVLGFAVLDDARHGRGVRDGACAARRARRAQPGHARTIAGGHGCTPQQGVRSGPRRCAAGARADAARRRRRARRAVSSPAAGGSRLPRRSRPDVRGQSSDGSISRRASR